MLATQECHREVVEKVLGKGARMDLQDRDGHTVLMEKSEVGHGEVVPKLLGKGASMREIKSLLVHYLCRPHHRQQLTVH